jgi:hypothetical protein
MLVVQKTSYAAALAPHSTNAGMFVPTEQAAILLDRSQSDVMCGIGTGVGSRLLSFATR